MAVKRGRELIFNDDSEDNLVRLMTACMFVGTEMAAHQGNKNVDDAIDAVEDLLRTSIQKAKAEKHDWTKGGPKALRMAYNMGRLAVMHASGHNRPLDQTDIIYAAREINRICVSGAKASPGSPEMLDIWCKDFPMLPQAR
ncbi:MAG TPA: hypothetical protein VM032_07275 [Vicinamibacterales bacterium]|nr:hypothetical protein [Vicinamibacterales bacterium]